MALGVAEPTVDVVIVNWNGGEAVVAAARSANRFGANVIVVDNASTDDSLARLDREPGLSIVRMSTNAGFAQACNAGARSSNGEFIFLLNPDAEIASGSRSDLVRAFDEHPDAGIVGPRTIDEHGISERSVRRFPTLAVLLLYQLKLHRWARRIPPLRRYFMFGFDETVPAHVDQVIGAAMIVRRRDWEAIDGMDGGFFLLFEDVDFCLRLAKRNLRALHWPPLVVRHVGHQSFRRLGHVRLQRIWNRSVMRYARKHLGMHAAGLVAATIPVSLILSLALDLADMPLKGRSHE